MLLDNFIKTQRIITQHVAGGSTINEPCKIAVHHRRLIQSLNLTVRHRETWGFRLRIGLSTSCSWISGSSQMTAEGHHLLTRLILHGSPASLGLSLRLAFGILPFFFALLTLLPLSFALVVTSTLRRWWVASTTFSFPFVVFSFPLQGTLAAVVPCSATVPAQALVTNCVQSPRLAQPGLLFKEPDALNELIPAAALAVQDNVLSALRIHSLEQNRLAVAGTQTKLRKTVQLLVHFTKLVFQVSNTVQWPLVRSSTGGKLKGFIAHGDGFHSGDHGKRGMHLAHNLIATSSLSLPHGGASHQFHTSFKLLQTLLQVVKQPCGPGRHRHSHLRLFDLTIMRHSLTQLVDVVVVYQRQPRR